MKKLKTLMIMLVVIITALTFGNISKAAENDQGRYCENGLYYEYNQQMIIFWLMQIHNWKQLLYRIQLPENM